MVKRQNHHSFKKGEEGRQKRGQEDPLINYGASQAV
jgi:hypothetical protein